MNISKIIARGAFSFLALAILPNIATATPTVEGYVISWTEDGWHQVQKPGTYESVCNGGRQCTVPTGVYTVINHSTGEKFKNIVVPNTNSNNANLPMGSVASTGQNVSYAIGDDGDYQSGLSAAGQRFQDNGDGTFEDIFTGLTWLSVRDCIPLFSWSAGIDFANNFSASSGVCTNLTDESESGDWRMPNIKELFSLVNYAESFMVWHPEIPFSGYWLEDPLAGLFWSSTSFKPYPDDNAIALNSGVGLNRAEPKTRRYYIWPVRDGL